MQLIIVVIIGTILGFAYGSYTDGFIFSTNICLFAGLTLIMPSLFNFKMKDIKLIWEYKKVFFQRLFSELSGFTYHSYSHRLYDK